jgi:hypothetical protein
LNRDLIGALNANTTTPPNHPFDSISTDETVSQVTISPLDQNSKPVYNFASLLLRLLCRSGACFKLI